MWNKISLKISLYLLIAFLTIPSIVTIYVNASSILRENNDLHQDFINISAINSTLYKINSDFINLHMLITKSIVMKDEYILTSSLKINNNFLKNLFLLKEQVSPYNNNELKKIFSEIEVTYRKYFLETIHLSSILIEDDDNYAENLLKLDTEKHKFDTELNKLYHNIEMAKDTYFLYHVNIFAQSMKTRASILIFVFLLSTIIAVLFLKFKLLKRMQNFLSYLNSLKNGKSIEKELLLSGDDELAQISRSFNSLIHSLKNNAKDMRDKDRLLLEQSKLAQMGEMLNMIAHQWRQPLNVLSASAIKLSFQSDLDLLNKETVEDTSKFIQEEVQKMSNIINDFMEFNKPTSNSEFFIIDAVNEVLKVTEAQFKNRAIILDVNVDTELKVFHNIKSIEHVLLNILTNSKDAFEDKKETSNKKIKIFSSQDNGSISLHIEDNAGGIPIDIINKVFNAYFTTKEQGKGTGIGLYMSKRMIEDIKESSLVVQNIDDGALFSIIFKK